MKYVIALMLLLGASLVHADFDRRGSPREDLASSSYTETAEANAVLITSAAYFYGVDVSSGAQNSWLTVYSTGTVTPQSSTTTIVSGITETSHKVKPTYMPNGISYTKVGNSKVTIYWERAMRTP